MKKYNLYKFISIITFFVLPVFYSFIIYMNNNNDKFSFGTLKLSSIVFLCLCSLFTFSLFEIIYSRKFSTKSLKFRVGIVFLFAAYACEIYGVTNLVYSDYSFKEWLITSSLSSINYKSVAEHLYGDDIIDDYVSKEEVDLSKDLINFDKVNKNPKLYANELEKKILDHKEGDIYKVINISGTSFGSNYHYEGYMIVVYDPSHVKIGKSVGAGVVPETSYGQTLSQISRNYDALVAVNAGGFYDPNWNSNGGVPHGEVIIDGKVDTSYYRSVDSHGLVGFTNDNKLILPGKISGEEGVQLGLRDAVDWGPYLVVNGVNRFNFRSYYGSCARTAIGQRADGIVLLLVIDGRQDYSYGAGFNDVAQIMIDYGAVNAANMDGGTSSSVTVNHEYINRPFNGYRPTYRALPNAWIVTK